MKKACFFIAGLFILPVIAHASDFVVVGYTEAGERSTAEDYEEEDADSDYTFQKYHLKLKQKVSDWLNYDVSSLIYYKDYEEKPSLDNISKTFKTNWSYFLRQPAASGLASDFKLTYKEKRYEDSPAMEYDRIRAVPSFVFEQKGLYTVDLSCGVDDFNYLEADEKDELKMLGKLGVKGYLLDKKLTISSSYGIEYADRDKADHERTKHNASAGFGYMFDNPFIDKLTAKADWGKQDTKDEDDRDEDYDFEYWRYSGKTEHRINPILKTNVKYQYFERDYIAAVSDHKGYYVRNCWNYELFRDKKNRLWLNFDIEHKDADYSQRKGNDYQKETIELKVNYWLKKRWKMSAAIEGNSYDFDDSDNDKERYSAKLSGERLFLDGNLAISIDFKYRYTDYTHKSDTKHEAVRLGLTWQF